MTGDRSDLYAALGVTPTATQEQIRRAYRRLMRQNHPDTRPRGDPPSDTASDVRFRQAVSAYAVLGDPARRAGYDHGISPHRIGTAIRVRVVRHFTRHDSAQPPIQAGPLSWHRSR
jgi:curved DNA-binding protein CbpA